MKATILAGVLVLALLTSAPSARAEAPAPPELGQVDVEEAVGRPLPRDLVFVDSFGRRLRLGEAWSHQRPVVLTLVYFNCPMLCSMVLSGLVSKMAEAGVVPGRDLDLVTVSFDPSDGPATAEGKRRHFLQSAGMSDQGAGWPFLTGKEPAIRALAEAVGFRYAKVGDTGEFAHAAVVFVATPEGTLSRYLYGIEVPVRDLRLSLAEAAAGRWGSAFDRFLLHCYRYDPATRRYGFYLSSYFRAGGVALFAAVFGLVFGLLRRERRERAAS